MSDYIPERAQGVTRRDSALTLDAVQGMDLLAHEMSSKHIFSLAPASISTVAKRQPTNSTAGIEVSNRHQLMQ